MPVSLEDIDREIARRQGGRSSPSGGLTMDAIDAEIARRQSQQAIPFPPGRQPSVEDVREGATARGIERLGEQREPGLSDYAKVLTGVGLGERAFEKFQYGGAENIPPPQQARFERQERAAKSLVPYAASAAGASLATPLTGPATIAGIGGRALLSGLGSAGGDVAGQAATQGGQVDPRQALTAGALGAVGQPIGEAVGAVVPAGVRALLRGGERGRRGAQQAIEDLAPFGTSPSVAQATGRDAIDGLESLVSKAPGGAGVFRRVVGETTDRVRQGIERHINTLTRGRGIGPETAGRATRQGIRGYVARFNIRNGRLWENFHETLDPASRAGATNTARAFGRLTEGVEDAPALSEELANGALGRMAAAFANDIDETGQLPLRALTSLRSRIGERLSNPNLTSDITTREYRQLYAGISEDLRTAAAASGQAATRAFNRANNFTRLSHRRIDDALQPLINKQYDSAISNALFSGSKRGPEQLRTLLRSVTRDQEDLIVADVLNRIGTAMPSAQGAEAVEFSFETFLTNWVKLRQAGSLDVLFRRGRHVGMSQDLDRIARAATRVRETSQAFKNPPGSGAAAVAQASMFGGVGSMVTGALMVPFSLLGAGTVFSGGARLLTSPRFVRWLAQGTAMNPQGLPAHFSRLLALSKAEDPETQNAILHYLDALQTPIPDASAAPMGEQPNVPNAQSLPPGMVGSR